MPHAPHYKGHGVAPEELVHTGPKDCGKMLWTAMSFEKQRS